MTVAKLNSRHGIPLRYSNRHGLITGATGTGKSVSLMRLAEQFSRQGVPTFVADVKGDLSALSRSNPARLLDLFGRDGEQISVTIAAMGADLMARALELTDVQSAVVEIAFVWAKDTGIRLDTIADFRNLLNGMARNLETTPEEITGRYGHVSKVSIGVVLRALLRLESQGGNQFFQAPAFDVADLLSKPGLVSILQAQTLIESPRLYSAFLLFLLSDLYARMPEIGDIDKPRLVFFFDEAHLLFTDCPAALLRRIEQTVRLIRSKGVGVYFVSQRPDDIPELVRSQLAHTIEHDRALPVGTARFSTMDQSGRPIAPGTIKIDLPDCPLGALDPVERPELPTVAAPEIGKFDHAGYIFLAGFAALVIALIWGVWSIYEAGKTMTVLGGMIGVWLAIQHKFKM